VRVITLTDPDFAPNFLCYNKAHAWAEEARRLKVPPGVTLPFLTENGSNDVKFTV
jgi:hypothetical protein